MFYGVWLRAAHKSPLKTLKDLYIVLWRDRHRTGPDRTREKENALRD